MKGMMIMDILRVSLKVLWEAEFSGNNFIVETHNMGWTNSNWSGKERINSGEEFLQHLTDGIVALSLKAEFEGGLLTVNMYSPHKPNGAVVKVYEQ